MELHDRAWEGFKIVVLAETPMLPMRIEQALATAVPSVEVQLSSFESYDQAYAFCKEQRDVGFLYIHEQCGGLPIQSVFRELSEHYTVTGFPAFGVILHDNTGNAFNERVVGKTPTLLDYTQVNSILDLSKTTRTLSNHWNLYTSALELYIFSPDLQSSLISFAEEHTSKGGLHFELRLVQNLASETNITWLESLALKWQPILKVIIDTESSLIRPHKHMQHFLDLCIPTSDISNEHLIEYLASKESLTKKVTRLANYLSREFENGKLESALANISAHAKPGAPKLVRHVAKHKDRILSIASDSTSVSAKEVSA